MKSCAICGRSIYKGGLCSNCWKTWTVTGTVYPEWVNFLIQSQQSFERKRADFEIAETDFIKTAQD